MQIVEKRVIYIAISVVLILAGIVGMIVNAGMGNGAFRYRKLAMVIA